MRTDVRVIASTVAVLFILALVAVAVGAVLWAVLPFVGLCGVLHHIDKNRSYYENEIDRIYGRDNELR